MLEGAGPHSCAGTLPVPPPLWTPIVPTKRAGRALKLLTRDATKVLIFSGGGRRWQMAMVSGRDFCRTAGLPMVGVNQDILTGPLSRAPGAAKMQGASGSDVQRCPPTPFTVGKRLNAAD